MLTCRCASAIYLALALLLAFPVQALADAPASLPIQGLLTDASGVALDGTVTLTLSLYDASDASVHTEDIDVVVDNGHFVAYLGVGATALDLTVFRDNSSLQLGLAVDGNAELTPRIEVATAPYAGFAQYTNEAASLEGGFAAADFALAGAVDWTELLNVPADIADGDADTQLDEAAVDGFVANNGYIDAAALIDGDNTTVPMGWNDLSGIPAELADGDDDTQLDEAAVDGFVANNGYAAAASLNDGDTTTTPVGWTDLSGIPAEIADGDADTLYTAGSGVLLSSGSFSLDTSVTDGLYWTQGGNAGTTAGTDFIGTTDDVALEMHVNGARVLRLEPDATSPNVIGGHPSNSVTAGVSGAFIGGGGPSSHEVTDNYGTIGGGQNNQAGDKAGSTGDAGAATVGGGAGNVASGVRSTIAGGFRNASSGTDSNVAGGASNTASGALSNVGGGGNNTASAQYGTIAGGGSSVAAEGNRVTDDWGTVAGGFNNQAGDAAGTASDRKFATVGGGQANIANGESATVAGGQGNTATGNVSAVGGGVNNVVSGGYSVVGGGWSNNITTSGALSAVSGGKNNVSSGYLGTIGGGGADLEAEGNRVTDDNGTVSGGRNNQAGDGAGTTADRSNATVGGGQNNTASGTGSTVGGGGGNTASEQFSTVAGGQNNTASGFESTVGGGRGNTTSNAFTTVGGGFGNTASNAQSTVGGGLSNIASGQYSTVPGGTLNVAAGYASFAAGRHARANNDGCFVWGDNSTNADVSCDTNNAWVARSSGGVTFYTTNDLSTGVIAAAGSGSWASASDRNLKDNIRALDTLDVLAKVRQMPVHRWRYKSEAGEVDHMGPMAQDFHAAFGLGDSDKRIVTVDADGVALAAIQGLDKHVGSEVASLRAENAELRSSLTALETRLAALESGSPAASAAPPVNPDSGSTPWFLLLGLGVLGLGGLSLGRRLTQRGALAVLAGVGILLLAGCDDGTTQQMGDSSDSVLLDQTAETVEGDTATDLGGSDTNVPDSVADTSDTSDTLVSVMMPTTYGLTSGGGIASDSSHSVRLSIGTPQPYGVASGPQHRITLGVTAGR